jgi:haloalkane dehalogenase
VSGATRRPPEERNQPVRVVFGAADPYLNPRVARGFHGLFPTSELFLLPDARHYVQLDEPRQVARLILAFPPSAP